MYKIYLVIKNVFTSKILKIITYIRIGLKKLKHDFFFFSFTIFVI
jgi:hypothetical protein